MVGLIDSHVHLGFDGGPDPVARMRSETDEWQLALMLHSTRELLGVGVTTVRDLGARAFLGPRAAPPIEVCSRAPGQFPALAAAGHAASAPGWPISGQRGGA
jgi:hypothetical protein